MPNPTTKTAVENYWNWWRWTKRKGVAVRDNKSENIFIQNVDAKEQIMSDTLLQSENCGVSAGKRILGGFELFHQIGRGASGTVFKARQLSTGRVVALKVLPPSLARNAAFVERFLREARAAARLNHPNIVQGIDVGQAGPYCYFAMEYVAGRSAREEVRATGPLSEWRALEIMRDTARALAHAHSMGIIHRDIKPDNILIEGDGRAKLADLGLACETSSGDSRLFRSGLPIGTPDYISPEQARGESDIDERTDIYSLGATLYYLLTGEPPYVHPSAVEVMSSHLYALPPDPRKRSPRVSAATAAIVRKAMAKDRDRRYATADEMRRALESALAAQMPQAVVFAAESSTNGNATVLGPARSNRRSNRAPVFAAIVLTLVIVAVGGAMFLPSENKPRPATADEVFAGLCNRAGRLVAAGDYDGAINVFEALPPQFSALLAPRANAEILKLKMSAEAVIGDVTTKARQLLEAGRPRDALAVLDAVANIQYRVMDDRIQEVRRRANAALGNGMGAPAVQDRDGHNGRHVSTDNALGGDTQKRTGTAMSSVAALLDRIDAAVVNKNFVEACRLAEEAAVDPLLQPEHAALQAIVEVGRALRRAGEVQERTPADEFRKLIGLTVAVRTKDGPRSGTLSEVGADFIVLSKEFTISGEKQLRSYRIRVEDIDTETLARLVPKWEPKSSDEWVAEAILGLAVGDAVRTRTALEAAKDHPLRSHYERKLAALAER